MGCRLSGGLGNFLSSPQRILPQSSSLPRIALITAGAAGMYCGSCLRDNALAATLLKRGVDIQLIPTYTPLRTEGDDVSIDRVFFGGINVYLQQRLGYYRYLPRWVHSMLDHPRLLRWAARQNLSTQAREVGDLTLSMLRGKEGNQSREVDKIVRWLATSARPDVINLSNMLLAGCLPEIRRALDVPIVVTLQGDDLFIEELPETYRRQALKEIQRLVACVDVFIVFTEYYANFMSEYFGIPADKIRIVPLGISLEGFPVQLPVRPDRHPTIGYMARLCPAKGLHHLVDAFVRLREMAPGESIQLRIAGWLSEHDRPYAESQFEKIRAAGFGNDFEYLGSVDRRSKLEFLRSLDVLSVPTVYREPKGMYVLEALASGTPVVQPGHGAFPELLAAGGGRLFLPNDVEELARTLHEVLAGHQQREDLRRSGHQSVHQKSHIDGMADATMEVFLDVLPR